MEKSGFLGLECFNYTSYKGDGKNTFISHYRFTTLLLDFSLTVKVATLIFISGRGSAISSAS